MEIVKIISLCGKTGSFLFSKLLMYHCIISTFLKKLIWKENSNLEEVNLISESFGVH